MVFLFIFFWVLFIGVRLAIFSINMDIAVKKRIWPIAIIGLGCALLGLAVELSRQRLLRPCACRCGDHFYKPERFLLL